MASAAQAVRAQDLQGFKYFQLLQPLLARLHDHATARDKAGNRRLHFDQYAALVLFYFFNPILTSLKGLQQLEVLEALEVLGPHGLRGRSHGSAPEVRPARSRDRCPAHSSREPDAYPHGL